LKKRKLKSAAGLLFSLCAFVCLFFAGCKTLSLQNKQIDLFTLFDDGADVYLHIPVNEANKSFVRNLVNSWTDDINESDLNNMLNRTEEIAAAFFIEWGANLKSTVKFQLASRGKYPSLLINAGLTKKNGWTDVSEKAADMILNRKRHSNNIELASPDNNHLFISNKNVLSMQKKYFLYLIAPVSTLDWPSLPGENTALPVRTLMDDAELVSVYMPTAGSLLPKMVGSPIELGIKYAAGTLKSYKEDHAIVTLKLQMSDERSLKIAEKLFRFAVLGTNIIVKQDRGTVLILDNFVVWPAALTGLLQKKR